MSIPYMCWPHQRQTAQEHFSGENFLSTPGGSAASGHIEQQLTNMEPVRTTTWSFFLDHYMEVFNFYPGWCRVPANSAPATLSRGPFQSCMAKIFGDIVAFRKMIPGNQTNMEPCIAIRQLIVPGS